MQTLFETLYALADMVNQFAYKTTFYGKDAVCDGGLSALENAFWVLTNSGCKMNSNGTVQRKNLWQYMEVLDRMRKGAHTPYVKQPSYNNRKKGWR